MKIKNFETDPHHATELPVEYEADAVASQSPAAIPTVAPAALLCPTRVELNAHWLTHFPSYAALTTWHELVLAFDKLGLKPELN